MLQYADHSVVFAHTEADLPGYPYLGSLLSQKANLDAEGKHCTQAASTAFGKLWQRAFGDHYISLNTKIVYKAVVIPTLLYGAESWTTYRRYGRFLEFYQRSLRRIMDINGKWDEQMWVSYNTLT